MLRFMLDTNICIYSMKRRSNRIVEAFLRHSGQLAISTIVLAELRFGIENSDRRLRSLETLEAFLGLVETCDFDAGAAAEFGEIRATLQNAGQPIGVADMLIAAHARALGLTLVTNNRREFDRVPGLKVENWV
jgi:tRNA(fMet)-specific endonuclease VapC